ncbi:MAG: CpaF family protein [Rickettsiales bacterium]|nr:CpaF family protein [Rickettsiales bacterium]
MSIFLRYGELLEARCAQLEHAVTQFSYPLASHGNMVNEGSLAPTGGVLNLDPITPFLEDNKVDDILINGPHAIYIERAGNVMKSDVSFKDHKELRAFAESILAYSGLMLDANRPLIDTRLPDGSRVNIIAPPLSIDGINISIRKNGHTDFSLQSLARNGSMSKQMADFLEICASVKLNIIISGGTGSGKTTLLNGIANHIRPSDRIVTIENPAELRLALPNLVRLEWVDAQNASSTHEPITTRDLVRNALRMRPDRIIVGEVRGAEAFDMMQAMNTGHEGSLTTIHANAPREGLTRIENMIGMANLNLPVAGIRKQIASAVHLVIQVMRMEDGARRVVKISEIVGMESDMIVMQDIFIFKQTGTGENGEILGQHNWTGIFPKHHELNKALRAAGMLTIVGNKT